MEIAQETENCVGLAGVDSEHYSETTCLFTSISQQVKRLYPENFTSSLKNLPKETWFARCANYVDNLYTVNKMKENMVRMVELDKSVSALEDKNIHTSEINDLIQTEGHRDFDHESSYDDCAAEKYVNTLYLNSCSNTLKNKKHLFIKYNNTQKKIGNFESACVSCKNKPTNETFTSENESLEMKKHRISTKLDNISFNNECGEDTVLNRILGILETFEKTLNMRHTTPKKRNRAKIKKVNNSNMISKIPLRITRLNKRLGSRALALTDNENLLTNNLTKDKVSVTKSNDLQKNRNMRKTLDKNKYPTQKEKEIPIKQSDTAGKRTRKGQIEKTTVHKHKKRKIEAKEKKQPPAENVQPTNSKEGTRRLSERIRTHIPKPRVTIYNTYITAYYKDTKANRKLYETKPTPKPQPRKSSGTYIN